MKPERIISGGQTGADLGGLVGAKRCGIPTGGTAPKGYRTDAGPQPDALKAFGLTEHHSADYALRTLDNVLNSDGTVLFGRITSPGTRLTIKLCERHNKPYITNPRSFELAVFVENHSIKVLNVAGNRERTNPGITKHVAKVIHDAFIEHPDIRSCDVFGHEYDSKGWCGYCGIERGQS